MFEKLIGKTIEVYIDNIVVKSTKEMDYLVHLAECFAVVREYGMKLNPTKCKNALKKLKEYFATTPVLMKPVVGEPLLLYMSVYDIALGTILVKEDISQQPQSII
ncbi:hypothetical protein Sango_0390500 [Sesamum angolense]|uniref:Reverse transcriptase domain-containing protein n=1 Tax=Sesamum angolense TaxID=2727404 RepID=A0AAE2C485_9LAMI|nr:hypothetical protein Sango_0390500 [Sesamum angolense]